MRFSETEALTKAMKNIFFSLILIFTLSISSIDAQNPLHKNGISFKALFMDYQSQNDGDIASLKEYHPGFEIGLHRNLAENLNINIPIKVGDVQSHNGIEGFHKLVFGADVKLQYQYFKPENRFIPYALAGIGGTAEDDGEFNIQAPIGLGLNIKIAENAFINLQSEYRIAFMDDRTNLHHGIGFVYLLKKKTDEPLPPPVVVEEVKPDSDGDGLIDEIDLCPQAAGPKELNGCPDSDGDGIADFKDDCPQTAGLAELNGCPDSDGDGLSDNEDECPNMAGSRENNGCPDNDRDDDGIPDNLDNCPDIKGSAENNGCPIIDTDGDGVADDNDKCPNQAGPFATQGCPDRDGDGVADIDDRCPNSPGLMVFSGCPDTDGDGIDDSRDRCPNTPGLIDKQGCPEIAKEDKEILNVAMRAVQFDTGKATLLPESYGVLNQIVDLMSRYPDFNLSISGHTDNVGSASMNQGLSERRAKSCYDYLAGRGVSSSRMSFAGFGETSPIANNNTLSGRALNRRVEFNLIPK